MNSKGQRFAYKRENKTLELYKVSKRKDGTYAWEKMIKAGTAKAEKTLQEEERKKQEEEKRMRETGGIQREGVNPYGRTF